ncbi:unnamed protein product [Kuraishia capsulata CBS 1993]|uniref:TLC domain-containing protein n=1 Tax=Kuraishia capsulata CBS 1993 TaxID=1382522 RepID=W6MXS7_9ASCO|nr:uncharacterized protein KUCA_T00005398001 [Kuraishia capsulata CBS 1993]CDK29410.1 unnamed protein product [Kuraishia capsulata CBS 1993]
MSQDEKMGLRHRSKESSPLAKKVVPSGKGLEDKTSKIKHKYSLEQTQIAICLPIMIGLWILGQKFTWISKSFHLQYQIGEGVYEVGSEDLYFVLLWVVIHTFIRAAVMDLILGNLASWANIHNAKGVQRFKEQGWSLIYGLVSFASGLYLYANSDYFLNCDALYLGWPQDHLPFLFKNYYLIQMGFWIHQIVVLHIEERRKDYYQMYSHHIITCALMFASYYLYFQRVGNVILVIMDVVDIFLSLAKMLKYCGFTNVCDYVFGLFMTAWIILRHIVYNYIVWHAWAKAKILLGDTCEDLARQNIKKRMCYHGWEIDCFVGLLAGLQVLFIIWMYLIARVAYKVMSGKGADDVRSDDEE